MYDTDYCESIAHSVSLLVTNDQGIHERIQEQVTERLRTGFGYTSMTAAEYQQLLAREGEREVSRNIRDVVLDIVYDTATEGLPEGFGKTMLMDLLDYGNVAVWERVARSYVPAVADYATAIDDPEADLY